MENINSIGQLQGGGSSFRDMLKDWLNDVDSFQQKADESIKKLASGKITDVHQVMTALEEAKVAFNLMMKIRNKQ